MVFSDIAFLLIFLPAVIAVYFFMVFAKASSLNYLWLVISSIVFYYVGSGYLVFLLLVSCLVNWLFGIFIHKFHKVSRSFLTVGIFLNIIPILIYKYGNFCINNINYFTSFLSLPSIQNNNLILPIGISFYTFQGISYLIDVYRKDVPPLKDPFKFLFYISFFPQLIAGPIVRLKDIYPQLFKRSTSLDDMSAGLCRFIWGLSKKVLIADPASNIADVGFNLGLDQSSFIVSWLCMVAYTVQIYFDFSGYSDMAIGIGRIFGFKFPRNFFHPYSAKSITDFWRRWHITLSTWFRDYLYIPLGGSRCSFGRMLLNLWIVFLFTGLWHGASWNYILWGALHGLYLTFERLTNLNKFQKYNFLRRVYTLLLVMFAWVLFRASDFDSAIGMYQSMFNFDNMYSVNLELVKVLVLQNILPLMVGIGIIFSSPNFTFGEKFEVMPVSYSKVFIFSILLFVCTVEIIAVGFRPFLYFQF